MGRTLIDSNIKLKYIFLTQIAGWGAVSTNRLLSLCGGIEGCFEMSGEDILEMDLAVEKGHHIGGKKLETFIAIREQLYKSVNHERHEMSGTNILQKSREILNRCEQNAIDIVIREDERYPLRFRGIPDMPAVLYAKGEMRINDYSRSAGIVGARRCTSEGKQRAIDTATALSIQGDAIVSGMAKGIDSYAHTAALKSGGYTVAVLGSGPDICYPKEHVELYEAITQKGCVLSEYPPGTVPREFNFPERNRLIAALSDELYVINTGRNSGTESTIRAALKYGRRVRRG